MYYFMLGSTDCRCDTAEELKAVLVEPVRKEPVHVMESVASEVSVEAPIRRRKRRKAKKIVKSDVPTNVPLIEGPITWKVTKKIGKDLGRTDYGKLRSELKARQG